MESSAGIGPKTAALARLGYTTLQVTAQAVGLPAMTAPAARLTPFGIHPVMSDVIADMMALRLEGGVVAAQAVSGLVAIGAVTFIASSHLTMRPVESRSMSIGLQSAGWQQALYAESGLEPAVFML
jgi:hypothetical protein